MIGQQDVLRRVDTLIENGTFPRFSIIVGGEGFGKHELVKYVSKRLGLSYLLFDNKMSDIRSFIDIANSQEESYIYVLQDGADMALQAKNSILKIIEEVPSSAYIILLLTNTDSALATILSRGFTFSLQPYTTEQLKQIAEVCSITDVNSVLMCSTCPGDVISCKSKNVKELIEYTGKVVDSIPYVSLPNILKVSKKVADPAYEYSFNVFCNALLSCLYQRSLSADNKQKNIYLTQAKLVSKYRQMATGRSVNKRYLIDSMIIDLWSCGV